MCTVQKQALQRQPQGCWQQVKVVKGPHISRGLNGGNDPPRKVNCTLVWGTGELEEYCDFRAVGNVFSIEEVERHMSSM